MKIHSSTSPKRFIGAQSFVTAFKIKFNNNANPCRGCNRLSTRPSAGRGRNAEGMVIGQCGVRGAVRGDGAGVSGDRRSGWSLTLRGASCSTAFKMETEQKWLDLGTVVCCQYIFCRLGVYDVCMLEFLVGKL